LGQISKLCSINTTDDVINLRNTINLFNFPPLVGGTEAGGIHNIQPHLSPPSRGKDNCKELSLMTSIPQR